MSGCRRDGQQHGGGENGGNFHMEEPSSSASDSAGHSFAPWVSDGNASEWRGLFCKLLAATRATRVLRAAFCVACPWLSRAYEFAISLSSDEGYRADPSRPAIYLPGQGANTPNFGAVAVMDP